MKDKTISTSNVRLAFQWREDVERGEMIEHDNTYRRTHMSILGDTTLEEHYAIESAVNTFYKHMGSPLRVLFLVGQFVPARADKDGNISHDHSFNEAFKLARKVPSR